MTTGMLIREARLRAGLTQIELAQRSDKDRAQLARWERDAVQPSLETLRELIRACGLELTFGLANYDDSYDEWILKALELTPGERLSDAVHAATVWREFQANVEEARARPAV